MNSIFAAIVSTSNLITLLVVPMGPSSPCAHIRELKVDVTIRISTQEWMQVLKCYSEWKPHWAGWKFCPTATGIEPTSSGMLALRSSDYQVLKELDPVLKYRNNEPFWLRSSVGKAQG